MSKILIIGNGIAGITAARNIRKKSDCAITVISKESDYFFSRTALMYVYMGQMNFEQLKPYEDFFWKKNKIDLIHDEVEHIDFQNKQVALKNNQTIAYDKLILATGSVPNKIGWPGENLVGVQGFYSKQDLENLETLSKGIKSAVIVGGGLIGIELAEMLLSRNIEVHFVIREKLFWKNVLPKEDAEFITKHIQKHQLKLHFENELEAIIGNENNSVKAAKLKNGAIINCDFVGLTIGVKPNIEFLQGSELKMNQGILVNDFLETNINDVYAIGDCAEVKNPKQGRRKIEPVWYVGRMMGETVAENVLEKKLAYNPGIWFNSAKFFDVEYQTYGNVPNEISESQEDLYWQHKDQEVALHLVWDKATQVFTGLNAFGWRIRHEVIDHWIKNQKKIDFVLSNFKMLNFNAEFYAQHERELISAYNLKFKKQLSLNKEVWWKKILVNK